MAKNNVTRMDQSRHTRKSGVCAASGTPLVNQVLRNFQYAMPGVEDTEAVNADLALIAAEAKHLTDSWKTMKRLLLQFAEHHGSTEDHVNFLLNMMADADLTLKEIDPDFEEYANREDELQQQRDAEQADRWATQKELQQVYLDKMGFGKELGDYRP